MTRISNIAAVASIALPALAMGACTASADGTSPAFPFAAKAYVAGGGASATYDDDYDLEIGHIVAGGEFVIPVTDYWNIQLGGGGFHTRLYNVDDDNLTVLTEFQASGIGFWRDASVGLVGIEAGVATHGVYNFDFFKLGGVVEYYPNSSFTLSAYGGALIPLRTENFQPQSTTGYYAGGRATAYLSDNLALGASAKYSQWNGRVVLTTGAISSTQDYEALRVVGEARYLTPMSGTEVFLQAGYMFCERSFSPTGQATRSSDSDGVLLMAGVQINLGGTQDSLVEIDRSNAVDTRSWNCVTD